LKIRTNAIWMTILVIFFLLIVFYVSIALATTINSEFSCDNSNAETTYYSYLKEPSLSDSGYARGLKTGSFNYFKGGHVTLNDTLSHYDGTVDSEHDVDSNLNASVQHDVVVNFEGEKGISEFYAKGFYGNNRAMSAAKKIWDPEGYPSDTINVDASAHMDLAGVYDFRYTADASNAYVIVNDASGWSNKTGARRVDWEQSALMKGERIHVVNNLNSYNLGVARGPGEEDWLPCCYSGTVPKIEPVESDIGPWPSDQVYATLLPNQKLPSANCTPYRCYNSCTEGGPASKTCPNSCRNSTNCQAFPCIFTNAQVGLASSQGLTVPPVPPLGIQNKYKDMEDGKGYEYTITVSNQGKTDLDEVKLLFTYPDGMKPLIEDATVNGINSPPAIDMGNNQVLWELRTLKPVAGDSGIKVIKIQVVKGDPAEVQLPLGESANAIASYKINGETKTTDKVDASKSVSRQQD
jgi:hypothetical protein